MAVNQGDLVDPAWLYDVGDLIMLDSGRPAQMCLDKYLQGSDLLNLMPRWGSDTAAGTLNLTEPDHE